MIKFSTSGEIYYHPDRAGYLIGYTDDVMKVKFLCSKGIISDLEMVGGIYRYTIAEMGGFDFKDYLSGFFGDPAILRKLNYGIHLGSPVSLAILDKLITDTKLNNGVRNEYVKLKEFSINNANTDWLYDINETQFVRDAGGIIHLIDPIVHRDLILPL